MIAILQTEIQIGTLTKILSLWHSLSRRYEFILKLKISAMIFHANKLEKKIGF